MHLKSEMVTALMDQIRSGTADDDAILVEKAASGDHACFQKLHERYFPRVSAIARGILIDPDESADAVQEVFTQLYRNLDRFDGRSRFGTWLYRVAVNRCVQHARRNRLRRILVPLSPGHDVAAPSTASEPLDARVAAALNRLNPLDRAVLSLFYWDDLPLEEVGEALGCGANAAKTRLFRARERFKRHYLEADE